MERLEADNTQIKEQLAATLPKIDEKVAEMGRAMEGLEKGARRSDADIGVQLQKTIEDMAQLRGQVETYLFKINELEMTLKSQTEDTDRKLVELQGSEAAKAAEAKRKAEEIKRPTDKKEFLTLAQDKAKAGDVGVARQLYAEFLKKWAKDELSGEAHYGLGETYYGEEKCREALFEYGKVIQDYGKTKSAPTAYLRSADCFKKLKMHDESKLALNEVMKQFPKSDAAKTAKVRLLELEKEKGPDKGKKKTK